MIISPEKNIKILFLLLLCAAALLRAYLVTLDINILLDQGLIQDDAFYYYVIARNILDSGHSSFDGINLTNGYHPLWQIICLPIFYFSEGETPLRIMLAITSIFDLLSLYVFFNILLRLVNSHYVALIGVAILALHGTIIRTWFNGLETAISLFSLLWLLDVFLKLQHEQQNSLAKHMQFGCVAAFSFLARTDNAIVILVLFCFLYLPPLFRLRTIKYGTAASVVLLALISPWLVWNLYHFGSIVQVSGQIRDNTWLIDSIAQQRTFIESLVYGLWVSISPIKVVFEKMFAPASSAPISGFIFIALMCGALICASRLRNFRKTLAVVAPFVLGVIMLFLYHAGVRHFIRGWYNASVLLMLTLVLCLLLDCLVSALQKPMVEKTLLLLIAVLLLALYSPYHYTTSSQQAAADPRIAIANWLNDNTPDHAIIGAANAGIVGYYTKRPVINLDGVVNESAFRARINNQLHAYIDQSHIDYVADHQGSIVHICKENPYFSCSQMRAEGGTTLAMRVDKKNP